MTNLEYMRQKMVDTIMNLDEMELLKFAEDTELSTSGAEGVFNCVVCEKEYGECGICVCTSEYSSRYLDWCKKERRTKDMDILKKLLHYEDAKQNIVCTLISTRKNIELLRDIPHVDFLDLSVVFEYIADRNADYTTSVLIRNSHLKLWDISVDELYAAAVENTQKICGYEIKTMKEVLQESINETVESDFSENPKMYVITNKDKVKGAACILYPHLLRDFAEAVGSSLYIIPSSIHEVLILPTDNKNDSDAIKGMIKDINNAIVSEDEILSYSLYFYNKENDKVTIL